MYHRSTEHKHPEQRCHPAPNNALVAAGQTTSKEQLPTHPTATQHAVCVWRDRNRNCAAEGIWYVPMGPRCCIVCADCGCNSTVLLPAGTVDTGGHGKAVVGFIVVFGPTLRPNELLGQTRGSGGKYIGERCMASCHSTPKGWMIPFLPLIFRRQVEKIKHIRWKGKM